MRKLFNVLLAASLFCFGANAQGLRTPAPSPTTNIKQDFGLSNIELSYSRPAKKNRAIFGALVPFDKVWRTGANGATTLTFGDEVIIGGKTIAAGKYGLLSIPGKTSWTIIITRQTDVTSPAAYKESEDVVRIKATPASLAGAVENFTMQFSDITATSCKLNISWDRTTVSLPIKTEIDSKVMAQIDEQMKSADEKNKPYFAAAMYYMDNKKDLNTALDWLNKAADQNPSAFWVLHQKANCLAKLGKKSEAIETAKKSITVAKEARNDDYVRLNEELIKKLGGK